MATQDRLDVLEPTDAIMLDWRDSSHHAPGRPKPCRSCFAPTFLLDDHGRRCHKTCAELELTLERRRTAQRYEAER